MLYRHLGSFDIRVVVCCSDVEGVVDRANAVEYGLAAGVFTENISKALHVSDRIQAGTVFVNTYNKTDVAAPFGGFKQSGFGKDLGEQLSIGGTGLNVSRCSFRFVQFLDVNICS